MRTMSRSGSPSTVAPPDRLAALVFGQFRLETEFDTSGFRPLASLARACADPIALELGEAAYHGEHQPARRCRLRALQCMVRRSRLRSSPGRTALVVHPIT